MAVHCTQHACVCNDECLSASLAVDLRPACKVQLFGRFKSMAVAELRFIALGNILT